MTPHTYLVIVAFGPSTSHRISGNDEHSNDIENVVDDNEDQEDHQDMPRVTAAAPTAAATTTKKPTAGVKTSGEINTDYPPAASSVRTVSRIYGLGTEDKYTITEVS